MEKRILVLLLSVFWSMTCYAQINVNFTINTGSNRNAISPLIYGTNQILSSKDNYKSFRMGGNRITGLNWETNASNAGSDYIHHSDNFMCGATGISSSDCLLPGKVYSGFFNQAKANNIPNAITTLPMAGYVSADKNGTVTGAEVAPSIRWKQVVFRKGSAFTLTPSTTDNFVYIDELVNYLKTTHGSASAGGFKGYFLDNEPALWPSTHARLHPQKPTCVELWTKSRDLSKAVKDVDPSAEIFGGVFYGFAAFLNFQDAPDWGTEKGNYNWFIDYYLAKMKAASDADSRRLVDVLDLHWYPEATGDNRIVGGGGNTANDKAARLQAPRSLWDPEYVENSWIATYFRDKLPLIPKLKESINTFYPGTKLSFSEYCYGGCDEITGGIANADVLGIFGKYGVYNANMWDACGTSAGFVSSSFKLYNNFNGNGAAFGNTSVASTMSDKVNTSIYASIDGTSENKLYVVVINKSSQPVNGNFTVTSGTNYTIGEVWGFDQNNAAITSKSGISAISGNKFSYTLPPLSAYHMVLNASPVTTTTTITVRAQSLNPGANMRVEIMDGAATTGGTVQQSQDFINIATAFTNYTYSLPGTISANRVRVRFTNDGDTPNRDLEVDYIMVGTTTYQTEDVATYSEGSSSASTGCQTGGYWKTQRLNCNGYFHYNVSAVAVPSVVIYDEALGTDWADWSWSANNNYSNTSPVKIGTKSLSTTYTGGWGGLSLRKGTALSTTGYSALSFWVHGGSGSNKSLVFSCQTTDDGAPTTFPFTATAGIWNEITIPLTAIGNPSSIKRINFQNNTASAQTAIFFDYIRLAGSANARYEEPIEYKGSTIATFYPNPLKGNILNYELKELQNSSTKATIQFVDLFGKVVYKGELNQGIHQLEIKHPIGKGFYLIKVKADNQTMVQKLFIEY